MEVCVSVSFLCLNYPVPPWFNISVAESSVLFSLLALISWNIVFFYGCMGTSCIPFKYMYDYRGVCMDMYVCRCVCVWLCIYINAHICVYLMAVWWLHRWTVSYSNRNLYTEAGNANVACWCMCIYMSLFCVRNYELGPPLRDVKIKSTVIEHSLSLSERWN